MDQDFLGKVNHDSHILLSRSLRGVLILDDTVLSKVAKGKGKTALKLESPEMFREARQGIDRQLQKLRFEAIVNVFVSRLVLA